MKRGRRSVPVADRIKAKVAVDGATGCHVWTGAIVSGGYGQIGIGAIGGRNIRAPVHRAAYEIAKGPIPAGLVIDHLCRNRACCNPEHLEAVTVRENNMRGVGTITALCSAKTHCPQGHPYDETNTYHSLGSGRICRQCVRDRQAKKQRGGKNAPLSGSLVLEIIAQRASGLTYPAIAAALGLSVSTVERYVKGRRRGRGVRISRTARELATLATAETNDNS